MPEQIPVELFDGHMECNVGDCGHIERFFHPGVGLMKMAGHLDEEHGITEEELAEALEEADFDSNSGDDA